MLHVARNATSDSWGYLGNRTCCTTGREVLRLLPRDAQSGGIKPLALPPRSRNLNAFEERWVRSVKEGCLSKIILSAKTRSSARSSPAPSAAESASAVFPGSITGPLHEFPDCTPCHLTLSRLSVARRSSSRLYDITHMYEIIAGSAKQLRSIP
jgi:hypothetical protein